jgi:pectinesterase
VKAANASIASSIKGKCALGRPWNSQHRSIFARTYEDASIISSGYIDWIVDGAGRYEDGITLQAEFETFGSGWNKSGREAGGVDMVMTKTQWGDYDAPEKVFQYGYEDGRFGNAGWIDRKPWL